MSDTPLARSMAFTHLPYMNDAITGQSMMATTPVIEVDWEVCSDLGLQLGAPRLPST